MMSRTDGKHPAEKTSRRADVDQLEMFQQAFESMHGNAGHAQLEDLVRVAREEFAWDGSLAEAARLLSRAPGWKVEASPDVRASRVTHLSS